MGISRSLLSAIDAFTEFSGRCLAWLVLAMALLTSVVVVMRYGFNTGSIAAQETVTYMHACVFMLGAAYALKHGAHVRVDIFYRRFSARGQAWVNALGCIVFLAPMCLFIFAASWNFVSESWAIQEISTETGGLPYVYLLKTLIPLMAANLLLQCLAEFLRALHILRSSD